MPYLNEVRLLAHLASKPSLSSSQSGRCYCNFAVRTLFRDRNGAPVTDHMRVTAYDDDAEMVVGKCRPGDLLLVLGYLTSTRWDTADGPQARIVIVALAVQRAAEGNGRMPPVLEEDVARLPGQSPEASMPLTWRTERNRQDFPQPLDDGRWRLPAGEFNDETKEFLLHNPEVIRNAVNTDREIEDEDLNVARGLLPDNLPVRREGGKRYVLLPVGYLAPEASYRRFLEKQRRALDEMDPARRIRILLIAEEMFGLHLHNSSPLPAAASSEQVMAASVVSVDAGQAAQNAADDTVNRASGLGDNADDWFQDESGEWHLREDGC